MKLKILIVDDHALMRSGLRNTLEGVSGMHVVGEASNGAMALKLAEELKPDLVMMDVHLSDLTGIEVSRRILQPFPNVKIIIFSGDASRSLVDEALEAGVCGYLCKAGAADELLIAVEAVMAGKLYLSPAVSGDILMDYKDQLLKEREAKKSLLSEQERQILRLIAEGRRNKEIADEFKLSNKSVEAYRSRMMKKLDCSTPAELVRYAIREGIAKL